ncbi:MAG: LysR family transcriptional regulator [Betaproteobacteria bacterium]
MDRLDGYQLFVRVVETGSFSGAARDLGVTQPTVTRHVAALEQRLGVRLVNRNTRRLSLTEAGRVYYDRSKALLDLVAETENLALDQRAALRGKLRIATSVAFGRRVVTPLILAFMRDHPDIEIDLRCDDAYIDLVAQGIDVSIRLGRLADSSLAARTLGFNPWAMVAAPRYLARRGAPTAPKDLERHDVLVYSSVHGDDHLHFQHPQQGRVSVRVRGPFRSNNLSSLIAAAREGMGVAALPLYVAGASLGQGRVEIVLEGYSLPGQEIHAVFPSPKLLPTRVSVFVDHLKAHFARNDWYTQEADRADAQKPERVAARR